MPRTYKYTGPLDEVELPEFGATVKRGGTVEVTGYIKHPDFEWIKPRGKQKDEPEVAPEPEPETPEAPAEEVV